MRVVVVGATDNVGTSVVAGPVANEAVTADITVDDLSPIFAGADAVVHLAWLLQPVRDVRLLERTNVAGTGRVLDAVRQAGVPTLVYASSVGTHTPGPKSRPVGETWPTTGIASSVYSRHEVDVESMLDEFQREAPEIRIVRLRKGLVFKASAASEIANLFLGRFVPLTLLGRRHVPVVPAVARLRLR